MWSKTLFRSKHKNAEKAFYALNFQTASDMDPGTNTVQKDKDETVFLVKVSGLQLFWFKSYRVYQNNFILAYEIQKSRKIATTASKGFLLLPDFSYVAFVILWLWSQCSDISQPTSKPVYLFSVILYSIFF